MLLILLGALLMKYLPNPNMVSGKINSATNINSQNPINLSPTNHNSLTPIVFQKASHQK
jgi:hypothetical protein